MDEKIIVIVNDYNCDGDEVVYKVTEEQLEVLRALQRQDLITLDIPELLEI